MTEEQRPKYNRPVNTQEEFCKFFYDEEMNDMRYLSKDTVYEKYDENDVKYYDCFLSAFYDSMKDSDTL